MDETASIGVNALNTAAQKAPGIYNAAYFLIEGDRRLSNGVYLADANSVISLTAPLSEGAMIQYNSTDYHSPTATTELQVAQGSLNYPLLSQTDLNAFRKPDGFEQWQLKLSDDQTMILLSRSREVYTITYENLKGASNNNPTVYTPQTPTISLNPPGYVEGWLFIGWFTSASGGVQIASIAQGSSGNLTLYAHWQPSEQSYSIRYENTMGASNPNPQTYTSQTPTIIFQPLSLPNMQFIGWFDQPQGGNQITMLPQGSVGNLVLYARWQPLADEITITFHGNEQCGFPAHCIPEPIVTKTNTCVRLPAVKPYRAHYRFVGWNSQPCGYGTVYRPNEELCTLDKNLELYAIWQRCNC